MARTTWEFYVAFRRDDALEARSIPLTREVQAELGDKFAAMAEGFLDGRDIVEYNGDYKADENSLLIIRKFELPKEYTDRVRSGLPVEHLVRDDISPSSKFVALFGLLEHSKKHKLVFQRLSESVVLRPGSHLFLSGDTFTHLADPGFTIQNHITAVLQDGNLYFESLRAVSGFLDITSYLMEASNEEMGKFADLGQIALEDREGFVTAADSWIRKKIHMILDSDVLRHNSAKDIVDAARKRGVTIPIVRKGKKQAIQIPKEKALAKSTLRFLAEDILDSPLSTRVFMTNSKIVFKP